MGNCGTTSGNPEMCITRDAVYRRSVLYTRYADKVKVPLDAADYSAILIMRRSLTFPDAILELDSQESPPGDLVLVTEDDSIRIYIEIPPSVTSVLPVGTGFRYTLKLFLTADPESDSVVLLNTTAKVVDTAV